MRKIKEINDFEIITNKQRKSEESYLALWIDWRVKILEQLSNSS
jgi:hypothetical protein